MNKKLAKVKNLLKIHNQEHLLNFYDNLTNNQKESLLNQILNIDFENILGLYKRLSVFKEVNYKDIQPLPHVEKNKLSTFEIKKYTNIGEEILKNNQFAVVTMAGGQGSRLGYLGPKGTYELNFDLFKKSLFEIICDNLKETNKKYGITLPWFIMTSEENDLATKKYFNEHSFFNYPENYIFFFKQEQMPLVNTSGKLILIEPWIIKCASSGNGNVFSSLEKSGMIQKMKDLNIKWVSFGGIDNILLKTADPLFLGLTIDGNHQIASKTFFKEQPLEKTAVYCKKYNKIAILDYADITMEISEQKDSNGCYLYREANLLSHIMSIDAICKSATLDLPYHRAFRKNTFLNEEGTKQVPDSPNTYKFEKFIFDAFSYFDTMLLFRVNPQEEFAPIKTTSNIYDAMDKYKKFFNIPKHDL